MVDFFLVLLQPGAGDELQGIKKGVLELADALVVNKADGAQAEAAERTQASTPRPWACCGPTTPSWKPRVLAASALDRATGIDEVWETVEEHRRGPGGQRRARGPAPRAGPGLDVEPWWRRACRRPSARIPAVAARIEGSRAGGGGPEDHAGGSGPGPARGLPKT